MADGAMCLVCVFDGLRPDMVRPDWTPSISRFADGGVRFSRSHCVFPSVTRVNAATLSTGTFPETHGIEGNTIWRPSVERSRPLKTGTDVDLRRLRAAQGRMLHVSTIAEILAGHGLQAVAVGTGSPGCGFLLHPEADRTGGLVYHSSFTTPAELSERVASVCGPLTPAGDFVRQTAMRVEYGARALTEALIPDGRPALATFWITIPDGLHHRFGLGAPEAVAGIQAADAMFGGLLDRLAAIGLADRTDVIVTADHGYSTVSRHVDVAGNLVEAGFKGSPESTDVVVCADGGACLIYTNGDVDLGGLSAYVARQDWAGVQFSRGGAVPGTLPLRLVRCEGAIAPDLIVCFAWDDGVNAHGVPGMCAGGGGIAVGAGDHGGISPFEMRNILFASGPHFRSGLITDLPCGMVDIAPTVLHCLGIPVPDHMEGRVLAEALVDAGAPGPTTAEEHTADFAGRRHTVTIERVGHVSYTAGGRSDRD